MNAVAPDHDPASIAERLAGEPVLEIAACSGGANNRVYRVRTPSRLYALKFYPAGADRRDRLHHEFAWLSLLGRHQVAAVPRAFASDPERRAALYEWIEGGAVAVHGPPDVDRALEFLRSLHGLRRVPEAAAIPDASEAFESVDGLIEHLEGRIARLLALDDEPDLQAFLEISLQPQFRRWAGVAARSKARAERTLSPSDFSFHNALRRPNGEIVFLDFEYAGWDDPVKVCSDFLWHPGAVLDLAEQQRFRAGADGLYGGDAGFGARFADVYPLFGLKWALIVLNDFLPEFRERRVASGDKRSWENAKIEQLGKASALLASIREI